MTSFRKKWERIPKGGRYAIVASSLLVIGAVWNVLPHGMFFVHEMGHLMALWLTGGSGMIMSGSQVSGGGGWVWLVAIAGCSAPPLLGVGLIMLSPVKFPWIGWLYWGMGQTELWIFWNLSDSDKIDHPITFLPVALTIFWGGWYLILRRVTSKL